MRDIMPDYNEIMEQHEQRDKHALQMIVQDEMSKMDETFENLTRDDPVLKAIWKYMESEGLALLMQGGKVNNEILAARLGYSVDFIRKAMQTYSVYLQQVFKNAEGRYSGPVPWENFPDQRKGA